MSHITSMKIVISISSDLIERSLINSTGEQYELQGPIGKGKYSVVFKGVDTKTNKMIVVKILKPVRKPKIKREISILQAVNSKPHF